jgi:hypothetical protein
MEIVLTLLLTIIGVSSDGDVTYKKQVHTFDDPVFQSMSQCMAYTRENGVYLDTYLRVLYTPYRVKVHQALCIEAEDLQELLDMLNNPGVEV